MQFLTRFLALLGAGAPLLAAGAPVQSRASDPTPEIIAGKYIIQLKPGVDALAVQAHRETVRSIHRRNIQGRDVSEEEQAGIEHTYGIGDFNAYAGSFDEATIEEISKLPEVLSVEPDTLMHVAEITTQADAQWGLGSISHREPGSTTYVYDSSAGEGTYVYVIDTGIRITHSEFEDRATWGYNAVSGTTNADNFGHGTHVAGSAVGKTYGVAKKASVIAVKVFEGSSGTTSEVLAGFNWAVNDVVSKGRQDTAVLNLSLTGGGSATWDSAVTSAYTSGVLSVVAAGNYNSNASGYSPARSPEAITVGNVQSTNQRYGGSTGSNYGSVLDLFAPGTSIRSADYSSDSASSVKTGTSMASPHVAGLVSYLRGLEGPSSAAAISARIIELSTKDVVTDVQGSPNRLAYNGNGA